MEKKILLLKVNVNNCISGSEWSHCKKQKNIIKKQLKAELGTMSDYISIIAIPAYCDTTIEILTSINY